MKRLIKMIKDVLEALFSCDYYEAQEKRKKNLEVWNQLGFYK